MENMINIHYMQYTHNISNMHNIHYMPNMYKRDFLCTKSCTWLCSSSSWMLQTKVHHCHPQCHRWPRCRVSICGRAALSAAGQCGVGDAGADGVVGRVRRAGRLTWWGRGRVSYCSAAEHGSTATAESVPMSLACLGHGTAAGEGRGRCAPCAGSAGLPQGFDSMAAEGVNSAAV